jgi:hypothetical protein
LPSAPKYLECYREREREREKYVFVVNPMIFTKDSTNFTLFRLEEAELIRAVVEGKVSRSFGKQRNYFEREKTSYLVFVLCQR